MQSCVKFRSFAFMSPIKIRSFPIFLLCQARRRTLDIRQGIPYLTQDCQGRCKGRLYQVRNLAVNYGIVPRWGLPRRGRMGCTLKEMGRERQLTPIVLWCGCWLTCSVEILLVEISRREIVSAMIWRSSTDGPSGKPRRQGPGVVLLPPALGDCSTSREGRRDAE